MSDTLSIGDSVEVLDSCSKKALRGKQGIVKTVTGEEVTVTIDGKNYKVQYADLIAISDPEDDDEEELEEETNALKPGDVAIVLSTCQHQNLHGEQVEIVQVGAVKVLATCPDETRKTFFLKDLERIPHLSSKVPAEPEPEEPEPGPLQVGDTAIVLETYPNQALHGSTVMVDVVKGEKTAVIAGDGDRYSIALRHLQKCDSSNPDPELPEEERPVAESQPVTDAAPAELSPTAPELDPYEFENCSFTIAMTFMPEQGGDRKVGLSIRNGRDKPILKFCSLSQLGGLPSDLTALIEQLKAELPERKRRHLERQAKKGLTEPVTKLPPPTHTSRSAKAQKAAEPARIQFSLLPTS